jgi:hypothetical protein
VGSRGTAFARIKADSQSPGHTGAVSALRLSPTPRNHNLDPSHNIPKALPPLHLHSPVPLHPTLHHRPKILHGTLAQRSGASPPNASPTTPAPYSKTDYVRDHITLGYAATVHSAQGVTANTAHVVIAESASRATAYVAMSRGRERNEVYIYTLGAGEADHEHRRLLDDCEVHQLRRGNKSAAAHRFRTILANDDRPRTMHAEAEHTDRGLLPDIVGRLLDRHDARRAARRQTWRDHTAAQRAFYERFERLAADIGRATERGMDRGYGLEL